MALQAFVEKKFSAGSIEIIEKANTILDEYRRQDLVLTLRQLYYQFVARGFLPNKQTEYKRLGSIVSDARLAGLIDWAMLEDRTRSVEAINTWSSPASIVKAVSEQYLEDLWIDQPYRVEVWIEKEALAGVIARVCAELRVAYFACRGYASQSSQYEAGKRFRAYRRSGQRVVVLHLGDHDPSGIDMTRDNMERIQMFAGGPVEVRRIALNMDQVETFNPPPNPAKESDARAAGYIAEYGDQSWELDALDPAMLDRLIRDNIESIREPSAWRRREREEERNRAALVSVSSRWDRVLNFVDELDQEEGDGDE